MYKVMLVDDEPLVREYLRFHIKQCHPQWEVAAEAMDGQEAFETLKQQQIDLVITDVKMPIIDGIKLSMLIRQMDESPQILILSGYEEFLLAQEAMRYGVRNYLLKPIVKEELIQAIDAVTAVLDNKNQDNMVFFSQKSISRDTQTQVVKQFLKAVVNDNGVEIKTLYPLIFRLKVQLINTEGIIMLLDLDEEHLIEKGIPYSDYSVFRFILQQIACEIAEETGLGIVFLDDDQITSVLVTGEEKQDILRRCISLYSQVAEAMLKNTGITVSGAIGTMESELFHLQTSHIIAARNLQQRLFTGHPKLFDSEEDDGRSRSLLTLDQTLSAVQFSLFERNEIAYTVALKRYIDQMKDCSRIEILKFGIHLIKEIIKGKRDAYGPAVEKSYRRLQRVSQETKDIWPPESVLAVFQDIANYFIQSNEGNDKVDEYDIASRAKAYIYTHYAEPLSLALVADKLGVSQGYLSHTFHKSFQETYIKFLTRIRMEQAARLLKASPPEKVYDVAEKVGYVSVKHFSHVFKQHFQMPPGEYQDLHTAKKE